MGSTKFDFEKVIGYFGIGSMYLLGFYLIDGPDRYGFSRQTTYSTGDGLMVAIPIFFSTYILGIFFTTLMGLIFSLAFKAKPLSDTIFEKVSKSHNDLLIQKYIEINRTIKFLEGSSLAFVFIGFGVLQYDTFNDPFLFVIGILAALLCVIISKRMRDQFYKQISKDYELV